MNSAESRVRVAYFVPPSPHFAGIERVVHEIATGLAEAHEDSLDVHVLFSSRYEDDLLADTRYTLHVLGVERLRNLAVTMRARIAEGDFDVLICPQVEASVIVWLATRGLHLPIFVSHLHGNPRVEEQDGSRRTRLAFSLFRHFVVRRISGIFAVSPSLRQYAVESIARDTPVYFAKNPVRNLKEAGAGLPPREGEFRFLNVARLSRQKGQDILLHALAIARPDLPSITLTLVGAGPDEVELRQLCKVLDLEGIVHFTGYASDPADLFRSADCFVLSSRWEGFGVVLVEALHFGLPLLAADCEFGPADLIDDPRIGELVAADSPKALAEGMKRAVQRNPDADGEAYRRATASTYARSEATAAHFAILQEIIAANAKHSDRLSAFVRASEG